MSLQLLSTRKMINNIILSKRVVSDRHPPLVIAEVSANHNNSLNSTLKMIDKAAEIGVEAIKFQTFNLNDMTLKISKGEFLLKNQSIKILLCYFHIKIKIS